MANNFVHEDQDLISEDYVEELLKNIQSNNYQQDVKTATNKDGSPFSIPAGSRDVQQSQQNKGSYAPYQPTQQSPQKPETQDRGFFGDMENAFNRARDELGAGLVGKAAVVNQEAAQRKSDFQEGTQSKQSFMERERARKMSEYAQKERKFEVDNWRDINGIGSAGTWAAEQLVTGLPQFAGDVATMGAPTAGRIYAEQKGSGSTQAANVGGAMSTALGLIPVGKPFAPIIKQAGVKGATGRLAENVLTGAGGGVASGAAYEAGRNEAIDGRMFDNALDYAVTGGALSGGLSLATEAGRKYGGNAIKAVEEVGGDVTASEPHRAQAMQNYQRNQELMKVMNKELPPETREAIVRELNDVNDNIGGSALYKAYDDLRASGVDLSPAAFKDLEIRQNLSSVSPVIGKATDFMGLTEKQAKRGDTRHSVSKTSSLGEFDFGSKMFTKEELGKFRQKGKESQAKDMAAFDDILAQLRQAQIKIEADVRSGSGLSKEGAAPQLSKIKEISEYLKRIKEFSADTNSNRTLIYDAMNENAKKAAEEIAKLGLGVDGKAFNPVMNAASYIMKDKLLVNQDPAYHFGTVDTRDKAFSVKDAARLGATIKTFGLSEIPGFLARRSESKARKKISQDFDALKNIARDSDSTSIIDRVMNKPKEAPRATEDPTRFEEQQSVRQEAEAKQAAEASTTPFTTGESVIYRMGNVDVPAVVTNISHKDGVAKIEVNGKENYVGLDSLSKDASPSVKEVPMATPVEKDTLKNLGVREVEIDSLTSPEAKKLIQDLQSVRELTDIASMQYRKTPERIVEEPAPQVSEVAEVPNPTDLRDIASIEGSATLQRAALDREAQLAAIDQERIRLIQQEAQRLQEARELNQEPVINTEELVNLTRDESAILNREQLPEIETSKGEPVIGELPKVEESVPSIDMTQDLMKSLREESALEKAKADKVERNKVIKEEEAKAAQEAKKVADEAKINEIKKSQENVKNLSEEYSIKKEEKIESDLKSLEESQPVEVKVDPAIAKQVDEVIKAKPTQEELQALTRDWKPATKAEDIPKVGRDKLMYDAAENSKVIKAVQDIQARKDLDRKLLSLGVDKEKVREYSNLDSAKTDLKAQRLAEEAALSSKADLDAQEFKSLVNETQSAAELARERYILDKSVEYGLNKAEFNDIVDGYRNAMSGRLDNLTKVEMRQIIKAMIKHNKDISKSRLKEEQLASIRDSEYLANKAENQMSLLEDFADSIGLPSDIYSKVIEAATMGNISPLKPGELRSTANKLLSKREAYLRTSSKAEKARVESLENSSKSKKFADKIDKDSQLVDDNFEKRIDDLRDKIGDVETKTLDKKSIEDIVSEKTSTEIESMLGKLLPEIQFGNNKLLSEMSKLASRAVDDGKATVQTVQIAEQLKLIDSTIKTIRERKALGYDEVVDGASGLYTGADQARLKNAFGSGATTNYMGSANKRMLFEAFGKYTGDTVPMWASVREYLAKKQELQSPLAKAFGDSNLKPTRQSVNFEEYTPLEVIDADSGLVVRASFTPVKGLSSVGEAINSGYAYAIVDPSKETIIDYAKNSKMANNLTKKGLTVAIPLLTMLSGTAMANTDVKEMKYDASKIGTIKGTPYTEAIGYSEARGQYNIENTLGYLGKFQMGWPAMVELGFIKRDPEGRGHKGILGNPNNWTGKYGVTSKEQYLNSPEAQEAAMRDMVKMSDRIIRSYGLDKYVGQVIDGVPITWNGLRASAHLGGHGGLRQALRKGDLSFADGYGTTMRKYMKYGATIPDDNA